MARHFSSKVVIGTSSVIRFWATLVLISIISFPSFGQDPGGGGGGGGGGFTVDDFSFVNFSKSGDQITFTYNLAKAYDQTPTNDIPRVELRNAGGELDVVQLTAAQLTAGVHTVTMNGQNVTDGVYTSSFVFFAPPAMPIGASTNFTVTNGAVVPQGPYAVLYILGLTPYPNMPSQPTEGTGDISSARHVGGIRSSMFDGGFFNVQFAGGGATSGYGRAGANPIGLSGNGPVGPSGQQGQCGLDGGDSQWTGDLSKCSTPGGIGPGDPAGPAGPGGRGPCKPAGPGSGDPNNPCEPCGDAIGKGALWSGCSTGCGGTGDTGGSNLVTNLVAQFTEAWFPSSFGRGLATPYDSFVYVVAEAELGNAMRFTDRERAETVTLRDQLDGTLDGIFKDKNKLYKNAKLLNTSGNPVTQLSQASSIEVLRHDGRVLKFQIYDDPNESAGAQMDKYARLINLLDRNGNGTALTYSGSTTRNINTVTDRYGYQMSFVYGATVAGQPAVTQINLPNGSAVTCTYSGFFMDVMTLPEGVKWDFDVTTDPVSQTTSILVKSPSSANRVYKLAQDFMLYNNSLINQPTNCFRAITTSAGATVMSIFPNPSVPNDYRVWYAGNKLGYYRAGKYHYYYTSWTLGNINDGYNAFTNLVAESTYMSRSFPTIPSPSYSTDDVALMFNTGAADKILLRNGTQVVISYDSDFFPTRYDYPDGTFETFAYNGFKQVTRHRNRIGNVAIHEYDTKGNLLKSKVGIKEVSGSDVNQPEYAEYCYEYFANGDLKTVFSPLHTNQTDLYRTDFEYYPNGKLWKTIDSADVSGGPRATTTYTYTAYGPVVDVTDPKGDVVAFTYDALMRPTTVTYEDGSTQSVVFGPANSATAALVAKTKDRMGVYTLNTYDADKRLTQTVVAGEITNSTGQVVANTDVTKQHKTTSTYMPDTSLVSTLVTNGNTIQQIYDYRHRVIETKMWAANGDLQSAKVNYDSQGRVFYNEDMYGRRVYRGYSASNGSPLIRLVQANHKDFTLADNAAVMNLMRSTANNAAYLISDAIKDATGNLLEEIDGQNVSTKYTYDSRDREKERKDAFGTSVEAKTETLYNSASQVSEVRSPRYFDASDSQNSYMKTLFGFTGRGKKASTIVAPGGGSSESNSSQAYSIDGRVATSTDGSGNVWTSDYHDDCCGHYIGSIDPLGHGTMNRFDSAGRGTHKVQVSDYSTHTTKSNPIDAKTLSEHTTRYDYLGRPVASTVWLTPQLDVNRNSPPIAGLDGISAGLGITTQMYYDSNMKDGIGLDNTTGMTVQKLGGGTYNLSLSAVMAKAAAAEASGGAVSYFPTNLNSGSAVVSINGEEEVSVAISDVLGRPVITAQLQPWDGPTPFALVTWTSFRYDIWQTLAGFGTVIESRMVDANGKTIRSREDGSGRKLETYDQLNKITKIEYNANGNIVKFRDPNNVGYDATHDQLGRRSSQTDTFGNVTSMTYNKYGMVTTETDAKGKVKTFTYDAQNRLKTTIDSLGGVTTRNYSCCRLLSIVDAENRITSFAYNSRGEKISETYPDHAANTSSGDLGYGIVELQYDPVGRLMRRVDQNGDTITFNHDMANRMVQRDARTKANSPTGAISDSDLIQYDKAGRILSANSGRYSNVVSMIYDSAGRLSSESLTISGKTYLVSREYDALSRVSQLIYPDSIPVERTFTVRGELHETKYNGLIMETRTYDSGGRLASSAYQNGAVTTWNSRTDNQIASIVTTNPGPNKIGTYTYSWDANKNKIAETITNGPLSGYGFTTGGSGYDDLNRVTTWNRSSGLLNQSWVISLAGDLNSYTSAGITQTRTHNPVHEFTAFSEGANSGVITYDAKGNLLSRPASLESPSLNLIWDIDNQLVGADIDSTPGSLEVQFQYDVFGRCIARADSESDIIFLPHGHHIIGEVGRGQIFQASNTKFIYSDRIDDMLVLVKNSIDYTFVHKDQQRNVIGFTNNSGDVTGRLAYTPGRLPVAFDAVGNSISADVLPTNRLMQGHAVDKKTKLIAFRYRQFDAIGQRFLSRDPLKYIDGPNLYATYFGLDGTDPFGLEAERPGADRPLKGCSKQRIVVGGRFSWMEPVLTKLDRLGELMKWFPLPLQFSWDFDVNGGGELMSCREDCDCTGRTAEYTRQLIIARIRLVFNVKVPAGVLVKIKGSVALQFMVELGSETSGCLPSHEQWFCMKFAIVADLKICTEDPLELISGCAGLSCSGGSDFCGKSNPDDAGWHPTGVQCEFVFSICAIRGMFCREKRIRFL